MNLRVLGSRLGLGLLVLAGAVGCTSVPVTGRKSLNLVSDTEVVQMSVDAFGQMKAMYPQARDARLAAMVQRVGQRVADAALFDVPEAEWEFVLFDDPGAINAFAMAGGKVGVFTGIFQVVETEADLAVVISHEIAHVAARHTHERLSQQMAMSAGGVAVAVIAGHQLPAVSVGTVLDLYGLGTAVGVALPYGRHMEREADEIGLIYMARAGYDPQVALAFWDRMAEVAAMEARPSAFLSTHPEPDNRRLRLEQILPAALREYEAARVLGAP